jgi:hypothetical protein
MRRLSAGAKPAFLKIIQYGMIYTTRNTGRKNKIIRCHGWNRSPI